MTIGTICTIVIGPTALHQAVIKREVLPARRVRIPPTALVATCAAALAVHACAEVCRRVYERRQMRSYVGIGHVVEAVEAELAALREPPRRPGTRSCSSRSASP